MILAKLKYKTHNIKLLAIIKALKTWEYDLKSCKYNIFVFANYNNLY